MIKEKVSVDFLIYETPQKLSEVMSIDEIDNYYLNNLNNVSKIFEENIKNYLNNVGILNNFIQNIDIISNCLSYMVLCREYELMYEWIKPYLSTYFSPDWLNTWMKNNGYDYSFKEYLNILNSFNDLVNYLLFKINKISLNSYNQNDWVSIYDPNNKKKNYYSIKELYETFLVLDNGRLVEYMDLIN